MAQICSEICPRTKVVPRSELWAPRNIWCPRTNSRAHQSQIEAVLFIILQIFFTINGICQFVMPIMSWLSIGFQDTHVFQFSLRLSNRLRFSWKNVVVYGKSTIFQWKERTFFYSVKDKKDTQKRQVVDMNKIIAFKKVCTEAAVNETAGALKFCNLLEQYFILLKIKLWDWPD